VINIHLGGGPSHQDMFDLKPEAPVEFRAGIPNRHPLMPQISRFPKIQIKKD